MSNVHLSIRNDPTIDTGFTEEVLTRLKNLERFFKNDKGCVSLEA